MMPDPLGHSQPQTRQYLLAPVLIGAIASVVLGVLLFLTPFMTWFTGGYSGTAGTDEAPTTALTLQVLAALLVLGGMGSAMLTSLVFDRRIMLGIAAALAVLSIAALVLLMVQAMWLPNDVTEVEGSVGGGMFVAIFVALLLCLANALGVGGVLRGRT